LQLPEVLPPDNEIERWLGEPVKALALPASIFIRNRKGFPVLPKAQQELVGRFLQLGVQACHSPGLLQTICLLY
jgi:type II protein arginine methyltransferase